MQPSSQPHSILATWPLLEQHFGVHRWHTRFPPLELLSMQTDTARIVQRDGELCRSSVFCSVDELGKLLDQIVEFC